MICMYFDPVVVTKHDDIREDATYRFEHFSFGNTVMGYGVVREDTPFPLDAFRLNNTGMTQSIYEDTFL